MGSNSQRLLRDYFESKLGFLTGEDRVYVHFHKEYPLCFASKEQYASWGELARGSTRALYGPCTDCLPKYQAEMIKEKRCEHPEVQFAVDSDGFISGYIAGPDQKLAASSNIGWCRSHSES